MTDESPTDTEGLDPDRGAAPEAAPPQEDGGPAGPPAALAADNSEPLGAAEQPEDSDRPRAPRQTVAGRVWVGIIVAVVLLVLLIIFIAENSHDVTVKFLGASGTLSLGLMMLIAAVAGVLITLLVGTTRILQLRREVHRQNRRARAAG